jgi:DNA-binding CsgD family transcriptional regulator
MTAKIRESSAEVADIAHRSAEQEGPGMGARGAGDGISASLADESAVASGIALRGMAGKPNRSHKGTPLAKVHLTPSEGCVLALLPTHRTLAAIGNELGIGRPTVKTHVQHIYKKLGVSNRAEAVQLAESAGLLLVAGPARQAVTLGGG